MSKVRVYKILSRDDLDYADPEIAAAILTATGNANYRFPLASEVFRIETKGISREAANAIRRSFCEMRGVCLEFDLRDFDHQRTSEVHMMPEFVRDRIRCIPLNAQVPAATLSELVWRLDVKNTGTSARDVYAGDLELAEGKLSEPLFNELHALATLQPGTTMVINNIRVVDGETREDPGAFAPIVRPRSLPLDVPEHPRKETHTRTGSVWEQSGFKIKSGVSNPRHHEILGVALGIPAGSTAPARLVLRAFDTLLNRLRYVKNIVVGQRDGAAVASVEGKSYFQVLAGKSSDGADWYVGTLVVTKESHTIGGLLSRTVFDLYPKIGNCGYRSAPHEKSMHFTIRHAVADPAELTSMLVSAVEASIATIESVRDGVREAV